MQDNGLSSLSQNSTCSKNALVQYRYSQPSQIRVIQVVYTTGRLSPDRTIRHVCRHPQIPVAEELE